MKRYKMSLWHVYKRTLLLFIIFCAVGILFTLVTDYSLSTDIKDYIVSAMYFVGLLLFEALVVFLGATSVGDDGIQAFKLFIGSKYVLWTDIVKVGIKRKGLMFFKTIVITDKHNNRTYVPYALNNFDDFKQHVTSRLPDGHPLKTVLKD